jgi:tetratricopeptide (TPR) repeat protein
MPAKNLTLLLLFFTCFAFSQEKDSTLVALEKQVNVATNDSLKVLALINLGEYQLKRDFNKARTHHLEISKLLVSETYDSKYHKALLLQQEGIYHRKIANYTDALRCGLEAIKIFEELKIWDGVATTYHNVGVVYKYDKDYTRATKSFKNAIRLNKKLKRHKSLGDNYNLLASNYYYIQQLDSVWHYYDLAHEYYEKYGDEEGIYRVMAGRAGILTNINKHEEALALRLKELEYVKKLGKKEAITQSHFQISVIYSRMKQYEKSMYHAEKSLELALKENQKKLIATSYKRRSRVYYYLKDYKNALDDYRKYKKALDKVYNLQKAKEIREIELSNKFQQERLKDSLRFVNEKELATAALEQQNQRRTLWMTILFLVILALVIIAYLLYRQRALRAERDAQEKLIKNLELQKRVETKTEEINELLTETIQHIKSKERIAENLQKLSNEKEGITLKSIIADLKASKADNAKLMLIKQNIEQVNFEFIKKLKTEHPKLTKTDVEICSLIRIGLSRKEVASLRNTSLDAVKMSRSRIKKKLGLSAGQSLDTYINTL